jgi:Phosphotransferase enzyme family
MRFFLKDYGNSRRPRPAPSQRRERELGVYRRLIGDAEIGTARYCGAVWDDGAAVHWLLLEFVAGAELRHMELRFWIDAARWLGRLQGHFAGSPALAEVMPLLERHDADFFAVVAERARGSVSHYAPAPAHRLEGILERYEASIDLIAGQELALVHGHYEAANILVADGGAKGVRICPVDWELAALGSRFFDLASLCDGFQPPALHRIWDAYAEGAADAGLSTPARDQLRRLVDCFRLFRVIAWLGSAAEKRYPPSGVERLLARGESLAPLVAA